MYYSSGIGLEGEEALRLPHHGPTTLIDALGWLYFGSYQYRGNKDLRLVVTSLGYKHTGADFERKDKDLRLRVIPTSVHGTLDYLASGVNLAFPALLELDDAPAAVLISRLDGVAGAGYSLITDYEFGLLKVLPMPTHLIFDAAKGALLASSPWLFGFAKKGPRYWVPHVVMGTADILAAMTSKTN